MLLCAEAGAAEQLGALGGRQPQAPRPGCQLRLSPILLSVARFIYAVSSLSPSLPEVRLFHCFPPQRIGSGILCIESVLLCLPPVGLCCGP